MNLYFAAVDAAPQPGAPKVRYFAAPGCALDHKVAAALLARMSRPVNLTHLAYDQLPHDSRLVVLHASEVC